MMKELLNSIKTIIKSRYPINIKGKVIKTQWYEALKFIIKHADGVEQSFYIFFNDGDEMMIISPRPSYFKMCYIDNWKSPILGMIHHLLEWKGHSTLKVCRNGHNDIRYFYNYCPICGVSINSHTRYIDNLKCCQCCHETCEMGIIGESDDGLLFSVYCAGCFEIQGDVYTNPFEALNEYKRFITL